MGGSANSIKLIIPEDFRSEEPKQVSQFDGLLNNLDEVHTPAKNSSRKGSQQDTETQDGS